MSYFARMKKRKEVILDISVIKLLEKKAKAVKRSLKNYMELVLEKDSTEK